MVNMGNASSFYLITPADPVQRTVLDRVELAARNKLMMDYKIKLNAGYLTTIACVYYESLVRALVKLMKDTGENVSEINFFDMFTAIASSRSNDDADKEGNINVMFHVGPGVQMLIDTNECKEIHPDMWQKTIINVVEKHASSVLFNKHKMMLGNDDNGATYTVVAYVYFEFMIRTLIMMLRDSGKKSSMINFLELFEIHASYAKSEKDEAEDEKVLEIKMRPGAQAKLIIKDDDITEKELSEDDV